MEERSIGSRIFCVCNTIFMLLLIFVTAYPMYYVVIASFSDPGELSKQLGALWLPIPPFTLSAYEMVFSNPMIGRGFVNTLIVLTVGLAFNITLTIMGAYFLALKGPMLKNGITFLIIFTMYFSGGLIPSYLNIRDLGLLDSLWSLILPGAISTMNLIIMKTAFQGIPESLIESARLDGASHLRILLRIMLPLSLPTLAVLVLYYGVGHWNAWFNASIYLQNRDLYPLQLTLREIVLKSSENSIIANADGETVDIYRPLIKYCTIMVSIIPMMIVYPFVQKYFVKGVMIGSIKG